MCIRDRCISGVIGSIESVQKDTFSIKMSDFKVKTISENNSDEDDHQILLKYPQFTRPAEFRGLKVPEVLMGGNHKEISEWRKEKALENTKKRRPDLIKGLDKK